MNIRAILFACVVALLFLTATAASIARNLLSNPPLIGDVTTAHGFDSLGDKALAAGDFTTARSYYEKALSAAPFEELASLGLARCEVAVGQYSDACPLYQHVILSNDENQPASIDLDTEYALLLQKMGRIPEAVYYFNTALDLIKIGRGYHPMDTYPADFAADGSDYNANELVAVAHVIRALNALDSEGPRISAERLAALYADPTSPIVDHYNGILLNRVQEAAARQSLAQTNAAQNAATVAPTK